MEQLDMNRGAAPLYLQISQILREKILNREYAYDTIIPSEAELQKTYGVSRITARQAIQELEKDGLVKRARGIGTVVIYQRRIEEYLSRIQSFTEEMKERGIVPATSYAHIERVEADAELAGVFETKPGTRLYRVERVRTGDGEPIVVFVSYFPMSCGFELDDSLFLGSIYELLEERGIILVYVKERFDCMMPDNWIKSQLDMKKNMPVLRRVRRSYMADGGVLEYTLSYYRSDRYAYYIELKKT